MTRHKAQIYISRSILLTMKHWPIAITVCVSLIALNLFYFVDFVQADFGESGWAGSEILNPDETISCDFETSKPSGDPHQFISGDPGAIYPAGQATTYWETNDSYCYWGNATSAVDTDSGWGIGKGIFTLDDPVGTSEYWVVNVTYWTVGIVFLSPTWTQIGSYSLSTSGLWCAGNLGVGITASATSDYLIHSQMHPDAGSGQDGWWWINGETPTDAPPDQWMRPEGGTFAYPFLTNTLYNRPFTLDEVRNMAIIIELSFLPTIFGNFDFCGVGGVSIAIGGLSVEAIPTDYTPPDYADGFILRPDGDLLDSQWQSGVNETFRSMDWTEPVFDKVNETTSSSDQETSYVYSSWADQNNYMDGDDDKELSNIYVVFNMTNPPVDAPDDEYAVYLWVIARSTVQNYSSTFVMKMELATAPQQSYENWIHGLSESYANYSGEYLTSYTPDMVSGGGTMPYNVEPHYSLAELEHLLTGIYLFASTDYDGVYSLTDGYVRVSQIAVICVPYSQDDADFVNPATEDTMNAIIWLVIIYLPALAISNFVPKLGFVAGMSLMLGIFGLAMAGFFQVSIMGFIAMIISLYKDW